MSDKVFRDPLYNYVRIDAGRDGWLLELLDCPEMQRLRRIHQLGVSNFTYAGADHNRLAHSMGVMHLMQLVLDHLERTSDQPEPIRNSRMRLLAAALLHDVGHGPFSHLFEPCLDIHHEEWSIGVVLDPQSHVHRVLVKQDKYLPEQVADLIEEKSPKPLPWQKALLSSQLDVDRLDYLRRDSLATGAGYGHFDWFRLLTTVEFHPGKMDLVWPEKAALAIEEYVFARYYMYQNVYLHKTTRGFEQLLQAMWRRAKLLRTQGHDVQPVPALAEFWKVDKPSPKTLPMNRYLDLEEFTVLSQIQAWKHHPDRSLSDLAHRFLNRDGFAMIEPPAADDPLTNEHRTWEQAVGEILVANGFEDAASYCLRDSVSGKYRQPYRPEREKQNQTSANCILLNLGGGSEPVELSAHLDRLATLTKQPAPQIRYYVPKEVRQKVNHLRKMWKSARSQDRPDPST